MTQEQKDKYKDYIDTITKSDGLVEVLEQTDEDVKRAFTLYTLKFSNNYDIRINNIDILKENISKEINSVSKQMSIFYISTILQIAEELDIEYDSTNIYEIYIDKLSELEKASISSDNEIMDLYYLSILKIY